MSSFTVALLQMDPDGSNQDTNGAKADDFCRRAKAMGADIALFPEMWNVGYHFFNAEEEGAYEKWAAQAIGQNDAWFARFLDLARELDMAIAATYLERWDGPPRNSVSIIDRRGEVLLTYAKMHTCDFSVERHCTAGDALPVCELDYGSGSVKLGCMICYDREVPETARVLMLNGAEVILTPNACGLERHRIAQFQTRAYENMVGVAMTNYPRPKANGHSLTFDCVCFTEDGSSRDTLVVEAGDREGIFLAEFDMTAIRDYRSREPWGNAFRHPRRYAKLLDEKIEDPFVREEYRP